jgi:hypothetical protein
MDANRSQAKSSREIELEGILRESKRAFDRELELRTEVERSKLSKELKEKDVSIEALRQVVIQKDLVINEQMTKLTAHRSEVEAIEREGRRQAVEAEQRAATELSRLRLEKENLRFKLERQTDSTANAERQLNEWSATKALEATKRAEAEQAGTIAAEKVWRAAIEESWIFGFDLLAAALNESCAAIDSLQNAFRDAEAHRISFVSTRRTHFEKLNGIAPDSQILSPEDPSLLAAGDAAWSDAVDGLMAAMNSVWQQRFAKEEEEKVLALLLLDEVRLQLQETQHQFSLFEGMTDRHLSVLNDKCRGLENVCSTLKERQRTTSRSTRANALVFDSMMQQHDEEAAEWKKKVAQLEDDLRYHKNVSKVDEAELWQRRAEKAVKDLLELQDEHRSLSARCNALQTELKDRESSSAIFKADATTERQAREVLAKRLQEVEQQSLVHQQTLRNDAAQWKAQCEELHTQLQSSNETVEELRAKVKSLEKSNADLYQKWIDAGTKNVNADEDEEGAGSDEVDVEGVGAESISARRHSEPEGPGTPAARDARRGTSPTKTPQDARLQGTPLSLPPLVVPPSALEGSLGRPTSVGGHSRGGLSNRQQLGQGQPSNRLSSRGSDYPISESGETFDESRPGGSRGGPHRNSHGHGHGHGYGFNGGVNELEHQMLLLKKERDSLRRQLDAAAAEISSSEEQRCRTMEKYLNLLNENDAAPKREVGYLAQEYELKKKEEALAARAEQIERRFVEVEKKEAALKRTIAAYQARGTNLLAGLSSTGALVEKDKDSLISGSAGRKSLFTPRSGSIGSESDANLSRMGSQLIPPPQGRKQLLPIAARPLGGGSGGLAPSSTTYETNPQKAPSFNPGSREH